MTNLAFDVVARRLTPEAVRVLTVRMIDCSTRQQLRAIGDEIRVAYARDDAHRRENEVALNRPRKAYEARRATMAR